MSSRLFVKNLPKHATDASLREFFSSQGGIVTDSKVLVDAKTGLSRRTGFVGFRTEEEAQHALKYFDKTFMTTSRILVQLAKPVGSEELLQFKRKNEAVKAQQKRKGGKSTATEAGMDEGEEEDEVGEASGNETKRVKLDAKHEQFLKLMRPNREEKLEEEEEADLNEEASSSKGNVVATGNAENNAGQSNRLFVRNLPYTCNKEELVAFFDKLPTEVILPLDANQRPKGFAIIRFPTPALAQQILEEYQAKPRSFQGRLLHVIAAQPERVQVGADGKQPAANSQRHHAGYKEEREAERRKLAGSASDTKTWNGLFLRGDAAAGAMASALGISKRELVLGADEHGEEDDAAIRVAMSEARVIQANKSFLQAQGVDLAALQALVSSNNRQEPTTVLLAKNLPETASEAELKTLFAKVGTLTRFVMPPSRTLALICYQEPADARRAMQTLAYSRYKSSPLYLQYAPASLLRDVVAEEEGGGKTATSASAVEEEVEDAVAASTVLFIKNLEFSVTEPVLMKHLASLGVSGAQHCSIPKRAGKKQGEELSSGFGFCQFVDAEAAARARKRLHGSSLLGHTLDVQISAPKSSSSASASDRGAKSKSTKLVVRNLAFEATKKDVQKLFGAAAQVKSVRLPKKMDGTTRGFAFVEFTSHQQAKLAKQALESAHLYGRRLVAEFAEAGNEEEAEGEQAASERRRMRE